MPPKSSNAKTHQDATESISSKAAEELPKAATRKHVPTRKQAEIDDQGSPAKRTDDDGPESEEEDEVVIAQKRHKSAFESQGIYEAPALAKSHLREHHLGGQFMRADQRAGAVEQGQSKQLLSIMVPYAHGPSLVVTKFLRTISASLSVVFLSAHDNPYPSPSTAVVWAARVWADVSQSSPTKYRLCSRIEKLITGRSLHARGALRDCVRPLIASMYSFVSDGTARAKQQNMVKYAYLLDQDAAAPEPQFHYADLEKRQGFAHNSVILATIKEHWFSSIHASGIKYSEQFSPIRKVTLTLLFTTVGYCLDLWATGLWDKSLTFANKVYHEKYKQHLRHIQDWGDLDRASTHVIQQRLYDRARRASGVPPEAQPPLGLLEASHDHLRSELAALVAGGASEEADG
ncbi:hypothetical protein PYCCODRAFT_1467299 [Trametes coccinea BRFM310]|uniref:DUF6532 domain-containing protein n=1 Tax=Trametes coccinea (strain BRFM310) TaxID=1353009 RepID=A0A1Y2IRZ6_TRAC3|nr:hypothetical protein PYCCODRAFT_1467299 [Trametes coccinea BRFM310]